MDEPPSTTTIADIRNAGRGTHRLLVLADGFGRGPVFVALVINLLLIGLVMSQAQRLVDWLGEAGVRAFGKVMSLFMTAIAVAMIRAGLLGFLVEAGIKLPG